MARTKLVLLLVAVCALLLAACGKGAWEITNQDHVHQTELKDLRLGDLVPLPD